MSEIKIYSFEQRSPEWYQIREGKITASPILNILGTITHATTKKAIDNLAMKLAIESVYGMIESDFVSFDMQRGIDLEPSAFRFASDLLGAKFIDCSEIGFAMYNEHIGASPDGLCSDNSVLELKCPNIENFFKLQIKEEIDQKHYAQMQHQMLCTNTDKAYYMAYCCHKGQEFHYMETVPRDEEMIEIIKERCEMVIELKLSYIDKLKNATNGNN